MGSGLKRLGFEFGVECSALNVRKEDRFLFRSRSLSLSFSCSLLLALALSRWKGEGRGPWRVSKAEADIRSTLAAVRPHTLYRPLPLSPSLPHRPSPPLSLSLPVFLTLTLLLSCLLFLSLPRSSQRPMSLAREVPMYSGARLGPWRAWTVEEDTQSSRAASRQGARSRASAMTACPWGWSGLVLTQMQDEGEVRGGDSREGAQRWRQTAIICPVQAGDRSQGVPVRPVD